MVSELESRPRLRLNKIDSHREIENLLWLDLELPKHKVQRRSHRENQKFSINCNFGSQFKHHLHSEENLIENSIVDLIINLGRTLEENYNNYREYSLEIDLVQVEEYFT